MKIKVSEAQDQVLDYLVAQAEGLDYWYPEIGPSEPNYSGDWAQGGPIIEREQISTCWEGTTWVATLFNKNCGETWYGHQYGPTPLIAAMRCYVTSKLGEEVEVPDELMKG